MVNLAAQAGVRYSIENPDAYIESNIMGFYNILEACRRDFTYVDDIVEGIVRVMKKAPERMTGDDGLPIPPYKIYNIGGGQPENLLDFVNILQEELVGEPTCCRKETKNAGPECSRSAFSVLDGWLFQTGSSPIIRFHLK